MFLSKAQKYLERSYPLALALGAMIACVLTHHRIVFFFRDYSLSLPQLYTAIFGWAAVQAGSLLGIYGMVFSKNDGFIGRIRGTAALADFYIFTRQSIYTSLVLTIVSIPILAKNLEAKDLSNAWYIIIAGWFALFIYAIASFIRVVRIFNVMVRVPDHAHIPG